MLLTWHVGRASSKSNAPFRLCYPNRLSDSVRVWILGQSNFNGICRPFFLRKWQDGQMIIHPISNVITMAHPENAENKRTTKSPNVPQLTDYGRSKLANVFSTTTLLKCWIDCDLCCICEKRTFVTYLFAWNKLFTRHFFEFKFRSKLTLTCYSRVEKAATFYVVQWNVWTILSSVEEYVPDVMSKASTMQYDLTRSKNMHTGSWKHLRL